MIPFVGYAKLIAAGILLIAGISIGWGMSDMTKVKPLQAEVGKLSAQLASVVIINQSNDIVMIQAKDRHERMAASYEKRLKATNKRCEDAMEICNLPSSTGGRSDAQNDNKSLIDRYNSMYP